MHVTDESVHHTICTDRVLNFIQHTQSTHTEREVACWTSSIPPLLTQILEQCHYCNWVCCTHDGPKHQSSHPGPLVGEDVASYE